MRVSQREDGFERRHNILFFQPDPELVWTASAKGGGRAGEKFLGIFLAWRHYINRRHDSNRSRAKKTSTYGFPVAFARAMCTVCAFIYLSPFTPKSSNRSGFEVSLRESPREFSSFSLSSSFIHFFLLARMSEWLRYQLSVKDTSSRGVARCVIIATCSIVAGCPLAFKSEAALLFVFLIVFLLCLVLAALVLDLEPSREMHTCPEFRIGLLFLFFVVGFSNHSVGSVNG